MSPPNVIDIQAGDTAETAAAKITLHPDAIFLLLGTFDASIESQVRSLCARALTPVALMAKALVVDNGSSVGLAAQAGQAAQQMDQSPPLLGILSASEATPDANHTHLMKLPLEWGDPGKATVKIVAELAKGGTTGDKPVIVILFGGGDPEKAALLRCARQGWQLLIAQGAGGLGDAIIAAMPTDGSLPAAVTDPDLLEILDTASPLTLPLSGHIDDQTRVLSGPIQLTGEVLADAWCRYDSLDLAAIEKQAQFQQNQQWVLRLSVISAFLAVLISSNALPVPFRNWLLGIRGVSALPVHQTLHVLLILVPITISILTSYNSRFREGNKWILFRAAAEAAKREIFRYRMRSGTYRDSQCDKLSAQTKLAAKITSVTSSLIQSEANKTSLPIRQEPDAGKTGTVAVQVCPEKYKNDMRFLTPAEYLVIRIEDQTNYFVGKIAKLYRRLKEMEIWILVAGGGGTLLAAIHLEVWVALTVAVATAITTKLQIDQVENTIVQYNIALTNLRNIESWWKALSPWERTRARNIDLLVDQTETTLERETAGWIQQMQSELDKLSEKQASGNQQTDGNAKK
jgi:SMODS and SLOG-associating 2TM effector domain 1/SLOG in TRPM, prokaryote/Protein of unknown function (DUF4231)